MSAGKQRPDPKHRATATASPGTSTDGWAEREGQSPITGAAMRRSLNTEPGTVGGLSVRWLGLEDGWDSPASKGGSGASRNTQSEANGPQVVTLRSLLPGSIRAPSGSQSRRVHREISSRVQGISERHGALTMALNQIACNEDGNCRGGRGAGTSPTRAERRSPSRSVGNRAGPQRGYSKAAVQPDEAHGRLPHGSGMLRGQGNRPRSKSALMPEDAAMMPTDCLKMERSCMSCSAGRVDTSELVIDDEDEYGGKSGPASRTVFLPGGIASRPQSFSSRKNRSQMLLPADGRPPSSGTRGTAGGQTRGHPDSPALRPFSAYSVASHVSAGNHSHCSSPLPSVSVSRAESFSVARTPLRMASISSRAGFHGGSLGFDAQMEEGNEN